MKQKTKKSKIDFDTPPQSETHEPAVEPKANSEVEDLLAKPAESVMTDDEEATNPEINTDAAPEPEIEFQNEKVKIEFPFSSVFRERIPRIFDVAETAATQWKNNEKFENLGVEHPVAEIALVKVLEKAKNVERKLDEKGIISAAKMGIQVARFQAEEIVKKFKKSE